MVVLYLIDARAVFRPAQDEEPLDWSCVGVFEDEEGVKTDAEIPQPALSVPEIEVVGRRTRIMLMLDSSLVTSHEYPARIGPHRRSHCQ